MMAVDRLPELLYRAEPQWHVREVLSVLVQDNWSDGCFPAHTDLRTVGDLLEAGPDQLAMRFREVDPTIWKWLDQEIMALCPANA